MSPMFSPSLIGMYQSLIIALPHPSLALHRKWNWSAGLNKNKLWGLYSDFSCCNSQEEDGVHYCGCTQLTEISFCTLHAQCVASSQIDRFQFDHFLPNTDRTPTNLTTWIAPLWCRRINTKVTTAIHGGIATRKEALISTTIQSNHNRPLNGASSTQS